MRELLPYFLSGSLALISGLCGVCVKILWRLADNVAELNQKMATVLTEMSHSSKRLERIETEATSANQRILTLERRA